ncbi:hypothetical protein N752_29260 [Desulforamulus aquiferis]|nr:hypothetical protein [Desulforamulus aquiferis]RYD01668.1 hypothetical protein N752_29260 [Desulforamulus aquiferis]
MAIGDKLYVADKPTIDATKGVVDNINTNIGSNADLSSSSGSVHAKLKESRSAITTVNNTANTINTNVSTANTNINIANTNINTISTNIGSNADASSATGSVHAKIKDVKTLLSTVNTNVGSNADASSATGSVHGKLKDIKSAISGVGTPRNDLFSYQGSTNNTNGLVTVLDVVGSGTLSHACARTYSSSGFTSSIRVTIDSQIVLYVSGSYSGPYLVGLINPAMLYVSDNNTFVHNVGLVVSSIIYDGLFPHSAEQSNKLFILHSPLVFKSNLKIEINYNSSTVHCRYAYGGTINR